MVLEANELRQRLRDLGVPPASVDAAWPEWWSEESAGSLSATAELSYTVARRLGLLPSSLLEDQPRYVWHDVAKFKSLTSGLTATEEAAITSFGQVVGRATIAATRADGRDLPAAAELRAAILTAYATVNLGSLVTTCWALGIPVGQLKVFPLAAKRMHAMSIRFEERFAVLIGYESSFASRVAFTVAHELGHIALGHHDQGPAIIDMETPDHDSQDAEEQAADEYALELLTGRPDFNVEGTPNAAPRSLATEATRIGLELGVDPGSVVTAYGFSSGNWPAVTLALKLLGQGGGQVSEELNSILGAQLDWSSLGDELQHYLRAVYATAGDDA